MSLDLVVADLWPPADAPAEMAAIRLPALEKWLARADILRVETRGAANWLASAFALPVPAPVAPVSLAAEDRIPEGAWLRADPVHLGLDRERTALHPAAQLDIRRPEVDAIIESLQEHFREDGLEFVAATPERWYVGVPKGELPQTTPLDEALGRDPQRLLPVSRGKLNWAGLLTEAQMLLATHDVNLQREKEARPPINSLWLWGGGVLPAQVTSAYRLVYADDVFARGLGVVSGVRVADVPARLAEIRDAPRDTLVAFDGLSQALQRGDAARWAEAARRLDEDWFAAIPDAIERFGSIRVIAPGAKGTLIAAIGPAARRRWFRRRAPLASYA
jgi:hypothetical protein